MMEALVQEALPATQLLVILDLVAIRGYSSLHSRQPLEPTHMGNYGGPDVQHQLDLGRAQP